MNGSLSNTVYIVDDDASVRDAVALLMSLRGYATALFANAEDFLAAYQPSWRGCLVLDLRMPGMSGLDLQNRLRELNDKASQTLPIVVITAHGDVAAARQAFRAQAVDFLEKPFESDQLISAVEQALALSERAFSELAGAVSASSARTASRLSPREVEVMNLLVKGFANRKIAEALGISHRTVEIHKARVLEKSGVHSVIELVRQVEGLR